MSMETTRMLRSGLTYDHASYGNHVDMATPEIAFDLISRTDGSMFDV